VVSAAGSPRDAAGGLLPYPVWIARGALARVAALAAEAAPAHRWAVISVGAVGALHAAPLLAALPEGRALRLEVPPGEAFKTRESWARLTDELLAAGCGRDTTVIALGGGVVGDLAGFVAATFMRGVPVVQVPTTLLAMVDASVGGKTAVDTPAGKNLVGAFHPPAAVVIDPLVLATLPSADVTAGLAEVIKHGVISDTEYLRRVTQLLPRLADGAPPSADTETWAAIEEVVAGSVAIKARVVATDEREGGMRKILNFGHTIGHAVEALSGFSLRHGECVAIGMVVEAEAAERAGVAESGTVAAVRETVQLAGLPDRVPAGMAPDAILAATRGDKKARAGAVQYALPERVGAMASAGGRWSVPLADRVVLDALEASA
jgi:3-dehydroquinate synthase